MSAAPIRVSMWVSSPQPSMEGGGWSPVLRFGSERPGHRAMVDGGFGSCVVRSASQWRGADLHVLCERRKSVLEVSVRSP
jgi:hypothetical protein